MEKDFEHALYLSDLIIVENLRKTIAKFVKILKSYKFDTIAYRGASGAFLAIPLALKLKKDLILVRKDFENEACHSWRKVEGHLTAKRYVIVDDCISSGLTCRSIIKGIKGFAPKAKCIGGVLVDNCERRGLIEVPFDIEDKDCIDFKDANTSGY